MANIKVGISEYKLAKSPDTLITLGLGSCVGIAIYDRQYKIGGLSHIMLPDSRSFKTNIVTGKFADLAIPKMVEELRAMEGDLDLVAKIAGGASMFSFSKTRTNEIGYKNIVAVENILRELEIPLLSKDVGGKVGRTMVLDLENVIVGIRKVNGEVVPL